MIRFHITNGDQITTTEWQEEPVLRGPDGIPTATVAMEALRRQYPNAAIRIERTTVLDPPKRNQVRFRIQDGSAVRYSEVVDESERESLLTEIRERFPKGVVTVDGLTKP